MALTPWATRMLQWPVQWVAKSQDGANPTKAGLSSDWGLQLDPMKLESLVTVYQNGTVNTFSSLVHTARQVKRVGNARIPLTREKVGSMIGAKS